MMLRNFVFGFVLQAYLIANAHAELTNWTQYKSQNFTLYSDLDKTAVEKALLDFEIFRATLFDVLHLDKAKSYIPVDVYAFRRQQDYAQVKPNGKLSGYFQDTVRGPVMVVGPGELRQLNLGTLYHEYLHYLVRANSSFNYPQWFDEGNAELYSSLEYEDEFVVIGKMAQRAAGKYSNTELFDLKDLLTETNIQSAPDKTIRQFYSTAWIFVHFLHFSSGNGFDDYRSSLTHFLNLYNKGVPPLEAFEQAFPISLQDLQKQLKSYNRKHILYAQRFAKPQVTLNYQSTVVEQGQLYANMSHLAFTSGQADNANEFLQKALKLNNVKALSINSLLLVRDGNIADAIMELEKLVRTPGLEAEVFLNIGQTYKELAKRLPERKDEMHRLAIYYLEKAKNQGNYSQTQVLLADLYWQAGEQQKAAEEIYSAVALMPANLYLNFVAGSYMVKIKNKPYANFFLGNVINWSKDPKQIAQAQTWLASL
jgi:tetratricopeptide (TPR) repeat protein